MKKTIPTLIMHVIYYGEITQSISIIFLHDCSVSFSVYTRK